MLGAFLIGFGSSKIILFGIMRYVVEFPGSWGFRQVLAVVAAADCALIGACIGACLSLLRDMRLGTRIWVWLVVWIVVVFAVDAIGRLLYGPRFKIDIGTPAQQQLRSTGTLSNVVWSHQMPARVLTQLENDSLLSSRRGH